MENIIFPVGKVADEFENVMVIKNISSCHSLSFFVPYTLHAGLRLHFTNIIARMW